MNHRSLSLDDLPSSTTFYDYDVLNEMNIIYSIVLNLTTYFLTNFKPTPNVILVLVD